MADDFGLGDLTDDQLIELARAVAMEFTLRDRSAYDAARAAAQRAKASVRRATPGIDPIYDWSIARRAAMMIAETLGEKWSFAVWQSSTGERRVYLDAEGRKVSAVRATHRPYQRIRRITEPRRQGHLLCQREWPCRARQAGNGKYSE
ncbi:MAG: hypothetical protein ACTMKV_04170 [Sphingomonas parapaucimobilis]